MTRRAGERIRRVLPGAALAVVVVVALVIGGAGRSRPTRSPGARAHAIAQDLRCPVCQGLSVADSPSPTAKSIYDDVRRRVDAGESDATIRAAYVARYGEWVLLRPPASGVGALVWILPVSALLLAVGGLALAFRRWRRQPSLPATDADRALVDAALAGGTGVAGGAAPSGPSTEPR
ncbi:MAG TPA: cytochrome c-type biogenesis protein CcmH [Acidimicrobiia bacterium]|jgi:cytochrome c-type biogenesis protein CcmH|nr:cytochrome c-type biogenesis protein CcmH [Acidimicrobiia bacterium]